MPLRGICVFSCSGSRFFSTCRATSCSVLPTSLPSSWITRSSVATAVRVLVAELQGWWFAAPAYTGWWLDCSGVWVIPPPKKTVAIKSRISNNQRINLVSMPSPSQNFPIAHTAHFHLVCALAAQSFELFVLLHQKNYLH